MFKFQKYALFITCTFINSITRERVSCKTWFFSGWCSHSLQLTYEGATISKERKIVINKKASLNLKVKNKEPCKNAWSKNDRVGSGSSTNGSIKGAPPKKRPKVEEDAVKTSKKESGEAGRLRADFIFTNNHASATCGPFRVRNYRDRIRGQRMQRTPVVVLSSRVLCRMPASYRRAEDPPLRLHAFVERVRSLAHASGTHLVARRLTRSSQASPYRRVR